MATTMTPSKLHQKINKEPSNYGNTRATQTRRLTRSPLHSLRMASPCEAGERNTSEASETKRCSAPTGANRNVHGHAQHHLSDPSAQVLCRTYVSSRKMLSLCWMLYPDWGYLHPSLPLCPPPSLHPAEDTSLDCHPNGLGIAGVPREDGISWSIQAQGRAPMQLSLLRRGRSSCDYTGSPPVPPQPLHLRQQELLWVSAALL